MPQGPLWLSKLVNYRFTEHMDECDCITLHAKTLIFLIMTHYVNVNLVLSIICEDTMCNIKVTNLPIKSENSNNVQNAGYILVAM